MTNGFGSGGPKTCGSGAGSGTLVQRKLKVGFYKVPGNV